MFLVRMFLVLIGLVVGLLGCVGPIVHEMTTDYPATVLNVVKTPPPIDGRERFRKIFCQVLAEEPEFQPFGECEQFLLRLNDEPLPHSPLQPKPNLNFRYRVMIVPGFLNECFAEIALPFEDAMTSLNDPRFSFVKLIVSGVSDNDANASHIAESIEKLDLDQNEKLILIGHSKGAVDILHFLVNFPHMARRVAAVVSVAGAINGSRLADRATDFFGIWEWAILSKRCETKEGLALDSLRPAVSMSWLANNPLPPSVRYFSLVAFTEPDNINLILQTSYYLLSILDPRNDGLLLINDQIIPGSTLLGFANADHLSVVLPLEEKNFLISETVQAKSKFPRKVLLKAMLLYIAEDLQP